MISVSFFFSGLFVCFSGKFFLAVSRLDRQSVGFFEERRRVTKGIDLSGETNVCVAYRFTMGIDGCNWGSRMFNVLRHGKLLGFFLAIVNLFPRGSNGFLVER